MLVIPFRKEKLASEMLIYNLSVIRIEYPKLLLSRENPNSPSDTEKPAP